MPTAPSTPGPSQPQTQGQATETPSLRKRRHRGGKKKQRRKSFAVTGSALDGGSTTGLTGHVHEPSGGLNLGHGLDLLDDTADDGALDDAETARRRHRTPARPSVSGRPGRSMSSTSLESEGLLLDHRDHRDYGDYGDRRDRRDYDQRDRPHGSQFLRARRTSVVAPRIVAGDDDDQDDQDEGAPLLSRSYVGPDPPGYGSGLDTGHRGSTGAAPAGSGFPSSFLNPFAPSNVNYPPSVPGSPPLRPSSRPTSRLLDLGHANNLSFGDQMLRDELELRAPASPGAKTSLLRASSDTLLDGERAHDRQGSIRSGRSGHSHHSHNSRRSHGSDQSGHASAHSPQRAARDGTGEDDVCFPHRARADDDDEMHSTRFGSFGHDDDDGHATPHDDGRDTTWRARPSRRRRGKWPDLAILDEWARLERATKEGFVGGGRRAKTITEPQLINGRLRPVNKGGWHRAEEDAPFRFTYFNEEFQSTIHSQSIAELVQPGTGGFRALFVPDPPLLSDSESDDEPEPGGHFVPPDHVAGSRSGSVSGTGTPARHRQASSVPLERTPTQSSEQPAPVHAPALFKSPPRPFGAPGTMTPEMAPLSLASVPAPVNAPALPQAPPQVPPADRKQPRYGERPVWWLDVLRPTEAEMKVLSKAFGIHPLTAEDVIMQEAREKVELFHHYYFVSYRSFDQDPLSETYLDPVNVYVVVFREGVLSFHFSMTPHPANVRRRIRQLSDYMILSSDWISYAIIDDITDVFVPLIQKIEDEVDDIDDAILQMHSQVLDRSDAKREESTAEADTSMLLRVGDCRKRVMSLYRLLGNKADVIKGFAKRCNEHWEVAPRSEIGLYLGDIQDHIVTMTSNLSHYEKILSRAHGNYLAQINIRMNERQEQTADVLGKLTVLGTIVLPMNIITGLWGMNVWVPGQEYEGDLRWFVVITGGLVAFGVACYLIAKRVYQIV